MSSKALPAPAKQLFRCLFEQASLGIAVEDIEGKLLLVNPALCSMLGYTEEELCRMHCSQFASPEDSQEDWALFQQLRAGSIDHYSVEKRYVKKDGAPLWGHLNVSLLKTEDGGAPLVFAFVEEVTKRKEAEEALGRKEEELTEAQRLAGLGSWRWDARTDKVTWSKEISLRAGHDPNLPAPTFQEHASLFTPESWDRLQRAAMEALQTGTSYELDLEIVSPTSLAKWVTARGEPLRDLHGQIIGLRGTVQDITERRHAEQELRESEQRFRLVADTAPVLIWMSGVDKLCTYFNKAWLDFTGRSIQSELGNGWAEGVHPDDLKRCMDTYSVAFDRREEFRTEYRLRRHDGEYRWVIDIGVPRFVEDRSFVGYIGIGIDVTERKQAEQALKKSEEKFSKAFRQSPMGLTLTSAKDHRYIDLNETFERVTGWRREEIIGRTPFDIGLWVNPDERMEITRRILTDGYVRNLEVRLRMRDGRIRTCSISAEVIELEGGPCILGVGLDVTERKQAEEALRESETRERARAKELEAILNAVPVPVLIAHAPDCKRITGNRAASEQLGVASGQNFSQSAASEERPAFRNMEHGVEIPPNLLPIQQTVATGQPVFGRLMTIQLDDGTMREQVVNVVPMLDDEGKPRGAVAASVDVTEQKRTEHALRESEDKLRLLLDSTAEAIYGIDIDHRCTFCNPACLRALGYERMDEVLGKNTHELIHHSRPDGTLLPLEECRIHRVLRTGKGDHAEDEVLWRANGTNFPAEYWSYPQRKGSEVVGAVVAFIDITQRKLAEAALANVSRKLIEAQEQERTRIARELHDDIGQRLAMLAIKLELQKDSPDLPAAVGDPLRDLWRQLTEIASDVQSLSHELHSSKLQYLGITAAMRSFCKDFSDQQRVQIDFASHDLPSPLSPDISLCLFRVLQESMHNSAKHSGVRYFEVRLN